MANRNFNRRQALEKEVKDLYAEITTAFLGVPTLLSGVGIESVIQNATGDYTIKLQDKYTALKYFNAVMLSDTPLDHTIQLHSESVASDREVRFLFISGGVPQDPVTDCRLLIKLELKNSSV